MENFTKDILNKLNKSLETIENLNNDIEFKDNVIKELQMEIFKLQNENTNLKLNNQLNETI